MERAAGGGAGPRDAADWVVDHLANELDLGSRVPRYEQLIRGLRRQLERRLLPPGVPLPPEPELAARLGVSRQTVNQALTTLAREGLLVRRRGIGTFAAGPAVEQPLDGVYSFIRTLIAQGRRPHSRLLGSRVTVDDLASPFLTGRPDGLVHEFTRLRLVDGDPLVVEHDFLVLDYGRRLPPERVGTEVLYDLLREYCDMIVTHADETLRPVLVDRTAAALLEITADEPAFLVERRTFAGDRPVEWRRSLIRGDRYRFRIHLEGWALAPGRPDPADRVT